MEACTSALAAFLFVNYAFTHLVISQPSMWPSISVPPTSLPSESPSSSTRPSGTPSTSPSISTQPSSSAPPTISRPPSFEPSAAPTSLVSSTLLTRFVCVCTFLQNLTPICVCVKAFFQPIIVSNLPAIVRPITFKSAIINAIA